jgi:hypothetical protein
MKTQVWMEDAATEVITEVIRTQFTSRHEDVIRNVAQIIAEHSEAAPSPAREETLHQEEPWRTFQHTLHNTLKDVYFHHYDPDEATQLLINDAKTLLDAGNRSLVVAPQTQPSEEMKDK